MHLSYSKIQFLYGTSAEVPQNTPQFSPTYPFSFYSMRRQHFCPIGANSRDQVCTYWTGQKQDCRIGAKSRNQVSQACPIGIRCAPIGRARNRLVQQEQIVGIWCTPIGRARNRLVQQEQIVRIRCAPIGRARNTCCCSEHIYTTNHKEGLCIYSIFSKERNIFIYKLFLDIKKEAFP